MLYALKVLDIRIESLKASIVEMTQRSEKEQNESVKYWMRGVAFGLKEALQELEWCRKMIEEKLEKVEVN